MEHFQRGEKKRDVTFLVGLCYSIKTTYDFTCQRIWVTELYRAPSR